MIAKVDHSYVKVSISSVRNNLIIRILKGHEQWVKGW